MLWLILPCFCRELRDNIYMTLKIRNLLLLVLLAGCWGPSFLFIKLGLESFGPLTLVNLRILVAALILLLLARVKGFSFDAYKKRLLDFAVVAVFSCALPFSLISMGEQYISSSLAAIINSTVPIFTVMLAHFFIADEKMTSLKILGVGLGFFGVLIVFMPSVVAQSEIHQGGVLLVFIAAISYGVGITYSRRKLKDIPFLVSATFQLTVATVLMLPISLVIEDAYLLPMPTIGASIGVLGLAIFGTAIAFNTYYKLVQDASASYLSTATLLFPVIGMALGAIFLDERLQWNAYVGSTVILFGLAVANRLVDPFRAINRKKLVQAAHK